MNFNPLAVERTITFSFFCIVPESKSCIKDAKATPVCGQQYRPVRSAFAAAADNSDSLIAVTTESNSLSIGIALGALTGFPIWIALASVGLDLIG